MKIQNVIATACFAVVAMTANSHAVVLLSDDFTVTGTPDTTDLNYNLAGRQGGTLETKDWTRFNSGFGAQVGNTANVGQPGGVDGNYLLVGLATKASLTTFALNSTTVTAPLLISFDIYNGQTAAEWTSFTLTTPVPSAGWAFGSSTGGFPITGSAGEFGFYRFQDGSGSLNVAFVGDFAFATSTNDFSILLTNTAGTGSAFDGTGSVLTFKNGATTIATTALAQMTTSYISFGGSAGQVSGIDNLVVQTVPEPSTWTLLALALTTVFVLRRRHAA